MADGSPTPAPRTSWRAGLLLAIGSIAATLLLIEIALRVAGFEYHLMPTVQFGWPDPQTIQSAYADDPDLFWVTKDYRQKLRAARRSHPDVIFLGDSCTEFGTYPARTMELLSSAYSPYKTGVHLAAGGWTSEQGLAQLTRDVIPLHPKVVVIYYGWNDHWMALGPTDPELHSMGRYLWFAEHFRLAQLALKARVALAMRTADRPNRVPPGRYRQNLEAMARLARAAGITPVFVTAPSNHVPGHEPEYLLRRHVRRLADVVPLHQEYVRLTREAAEHEGAVLCDAATDFAAFPLPGDRYFKADGIHFTPDGDLALARIVSTCVVPTIPGPRAPSARTAADGHSLLSDP
jgi:lysophospholipase L1-like esterase